MGLEDKKDVNFKWNKWHGGQVAIIRSDWMGESVLRLLVREYSDGSLDGEIDLQLGNRQPWQILLLQGYPHGIDSLKSKLEEWANKFINLKWEQ